MTTLQIESWSYTLFWTPLGRVVHRFWVLSEVDAAGR
jgi:hypothetical protein